MLVSPILCVVCYGYLDVLFGVVRNRLKIDLEIEMGVLLRTFIKDYKNTDDTKVREAYGKLSGTVGIVTNLILFLGKLFIGTMAGSIAITADAFNNLTDASSSVITLVGFKLSNIPPDKDHPYGHARYEYLAALVVAALTLVV